MPASEKNQKLLEAASEAQIMGVIGQLSTENADVNTTDSKGNTPLMLAITSGRGRFIAQNLIQRWGADINHANSDGETALALAVREKDASLTTFLLLMGAALPKDKGPRSLSNTAQRSASPEMRALAPYLSGKKPITALAAEEDAKLRHVQFVGIQENNFPHLSPQEVSSRAFRKVVVLTPHGS